MVGKMLRNMVVGGEAGLMMDVRELSSENQALEERNTIMIQTANQRLSQMAASIKELNAERMELAAAGSSARKTIEMMAKKIAQLTGERSENVLSMFNMQRSRFYDETLNAMLVDKRLVADPRKTELMKSRSWYTPDTPTSP